MSNTTTLEIAGTSGGTSISSRIVRALRASNNPSTQVIVEIQKGPHVEVVRRTVQRAIDDLNWLVPESTITVVTP